MSTTRFLQILFSLAVIAALTLAAAPAPVYALSASTASVAISGNGAGQVGAPVLPPNVLVCRTVVVRYSSHQIVVRSCHRVRRPI